MLLQGMAGQGLLHCQDALPCLFFSPFLCLHSLLQKIVLTPTEMRGFFFFFFFLWLYLKHMEVPELGVELEL